MSGERGGVDADGVGCRAYVSGEGESLQGCEQRDRPDFHFNVIPLDAGLRLGCWGQRQENLSRDWDSPPGKGQWVACIRCWQWSGEKTHIPAGGRESDER